jgi:hypothetical protein
MDEQELQRLLQQAQEEIRTLGAVSKETADKIEDAGDEHAKLKKVLKQQGEQFARTMVGITRAVGEGNTEFTVFNSVVDSVTGALTEMGKSIPFFGAAMVAAGEGAKFLLGQLQATTKAFNQVGAAGALGAEGMSGLRNQFIEAGIDLQTYTKVIAANSEALARFGGTAGDGAARFSKALGQVNRDFGRQLMSLGNSFEDVAEQTASFIALQGRLGRSQNMTQAQLAKGAFEYAKELDELARLTGQQKNQIIKQQDAAMSESRFRAKYEDMVAKGRVKEAKAMLDFQSRISAVSPVLGQGLRDIAAGFVNTEAAQAAFITTGGRAATIMQQLSAGTMTQEQAFAELQAANKQTIPLQRSLAMAVGDLPGVMIPFAQSADFANQKIAEFGRAAGVQASQMAGADGLTQSAVAAQQSMMTFSIAVNNLATQALPQAGTAVSAFADVMTKAVNAISKATGVQVQMPQQQYADGGIARGPASGYTATLHGAEAVVPLPDGNTIPVEIKGLTSDILIETLAKTLAKANLLQREMAGGGLGAAANISDSFRRGVDDMFTVAAMHAAEAVTRGIDYAKQLSITPEFTQSQLMRKMAKGGITDGPSIAGEAGPEAVVPLPDGKSIPVDLKGLADTDLIRKIAEVTAKLNIIQGPNLTEVAQNFSESAKTELRRMAQFVADATTEAVVRGIDVAAATKITPAMPLDELKKKFMADGGITQGPSIAGEAGPEAVVPLPNGRSIPVDMPGLVDGLQELISLMRMQNGISNKILQAANN